MGGKRLKSENTSESKGIVSWPEDERPCERLLSHGPHALTDAELIAILVRVGFQGTNAIELGRKLLKQFGTLRAMAEAPLSALLDVKGLKGAKVAQLAAAMEIARRVSLPDKREKIQIKSTEQAANYLRERLRGLSDEHFRVLYLNRQTHLLEDALLAQGDVDNVRPPIRSIVARVGIRNL
jgi:DNA repair protein RadC